MSRRVIAACALGLMLMGLGVGLARQRSSARAARAVAYAREALPRRLGSFAIEHQSFAGALAAWSTRSGIPVRPRWDSIRSAGTPADTPVTIHLRNPTATQALDALLACGGGGVSDLRYYVDSRGSVVVAPAAGEEPDPVVVRTYDVRRLLTDEGFDSRALELTIIQFIEPSTWTANGGSQGSLHISGGTLTVLHTREVQWQVAELLPHPPTAPSYALKLAAKVTTCQFNEQRLEDVLKQKSREVGLPIEPRWHVLEASGVFRNQPVTARLRNVRLSKMLNVMMDAASGKARLAWELDEQRPVIIVSTVADLFARQSVVRYYDVDGLLAQVPSDSRPQLADALVKLVTDSVASDAWGEGLGQIRLSHGRLWVRQTPQNQRAVSSVLDQVRKRHPGANARNSEPFDEVFPLDDGGPR